MSQLSEDVRSCINAIADRNNGRIRPDDVLKHARDPSSPLHNCFEWDTGKAAMAHWLERARDIIRAVRVDVTTETTLVRSIAYVRDPSAGAGEQGYISVTTLRTDEDLAREAIVYEFARAAAALERAREVAAALRLNSEVESLIKRLQKVKSKAENPRREVTSNEQRSRG